MMTRKSLLSGLWKAPLVALGAIATARAEDSDKTMIIGPGTYTIAQGGGISIVGASDVRIEGCTMEAGTIKGA
jgi:hypothetical protein